ncbi:MAG TPA: dihydropteroate synthase [Bacteroidia bacterium]|nr:dihydropteroate synthase [Bacteroidia bacterium]
METRNSKVDEDTYFRVKNTLDCSGTLLDLSTPRIMGILNLTPDSFHDGGRYLTEKEYVSRAGQLFEAGADILDIGGQSTRPGAVTISSEEEWLRVEQPIRKIRKEFPQSILSIDTFHSMVAERAIENGVSVINDISGGSMDKKMYAVAGRLKVPYVLMHIRGTPLTMQTNPEYDDLVKEVFDFFTKKIDVLISHGINDIVLDPGFGFGKNNEHNYSLLSNLSLFRMTGFPVLAGVSRKSMITRVLNVTNNEALNGTTVLNTLALLQGASLLRVHDVKEAIETRKLVHEYRRVQKS